MERTKPFKVTPKPTDQELQPSDPPGYNVTFVDLLTGEERYGRNPERVERILMKLLEVWEVRTDERLGQLLTNVMRDHWAKKGADNRSIGLNYNVEDYEFEAVLDKAVEEARRIRARKEKRAAARCVLCNRPDSPAHKNMESYSDAWGENDPMCHECFAFQKTILHHAHTEQDCANCSRFLKGLEARRKLYTHP